MMRWVILIVLALPASAAAQASRSVEAPPLPVAPTPIAVIQDGPPPTATEEGQEGTPDASVFVPTPTPLPDALGERFSRPPQGQSEAIAPGMQPIDNTDTVPKQVAELRGLDKMTGAITTTMIRVGEGQQILRLYVALDACRAPEGGDIQGTRAFLRIWDTKGEEPLALFAGWMFADSPALSALDHPRYDVWVLGCQD